MQPTSHAIAIEPDHIWPDQFGQIIEFTGDQRRTLLIAGTGRSDDQLGRLASALDQRVLGHVPLAGLSARLSQTIALDGLLIDLRGIDLDEATWSAVVRGNRERCHLGACRLIILFDTAAIDLVVADLDGPDCTLLCEPDVTEIVSALAVFGAEASFGHAPGFADVAREGDPSRLDVLSEEVRRLALTIERLASNDEAWPNERRSPVGDRRRGQRATAAIEDAAVDPASAAPPSYAEVRILIRARRMRDRFLPAELFADPAWDMILDLLAARLAGKRVSVSSLCIAAAVPPTTALRWIRQLTDRDIFIRIDDPVDGRRVFIELSDEASEGVMAWARAIRANGGLLPARAA